MSTQTTERVRVSATEFKQYGRLIADTLVEAINDHGVTHRHIDGAHVRLYCGNRDVIPMKVSKSRQSEQQLKWLLQWLGENVPSWNDRHVTESTLARLREVFNGPEEGTMATTTKTDVVVGVGPEWVPAKIGPDQKDWGFDTDGKQFRCRTCGYLKSNGQGAHLHERTHTVEGREEIRKIAGIGGKAAQAKQKAKQQKPTPVVEPRNAVEMALDAPAPGYPQGLRAAYPDPEHEVTVTHPDGTVEAYDDWAKRMDEDSQEARERRVVYQSLVALAAAHGYSITKGDPQEVAVLRAELAAAVAERDEARTRLALVQEAMQA